MQGWILARGAQADRAGPLLKGRAGRGRAQPGETVGRMESVGTSQMNCQPASFAQRASTVRTVPSARFSFHSVLTGGAGAGADIVAEGAGAPPVGALTVPGVFGANDCLAGTAKLEGAAVASASVRIA